MIGKVCLYESVGLSQILCKLQNLQAIGLEIIL